MNVLHLFQKRDKDTKYPINEAIKEIKNGNHDLREKLIRDYKPFIIKVVSHSIGKFVEIENSDEYSIGLIAFNEAIDCYIEERNHNFLNFAEQVIKRRIIDFKRSNFKNENTVPFTYYEQEDDSNNFEEKYLKSESSSQFEGIEVREEIEYLKEILSEYGITMMDLVLNSPKHKDSLKLATKMARELADNKVLYEKMIKNKTLPIAELLKIFNVHRRTIEKHRKFIIAIALILKSNVEVSKEYVRNIEKVENN